MAINRHIVSYIVYSRIIKMQGMQKKQEQELER
jgi:hypothetical protein